MLKSKLLPLVGVFGLVALTAGGTRSARAAEIDFGGATLTACAAGAGSGDLGAVCNSQSFTEGGINFTATGYSDGSSFSAATYLTQRTGGSVDESGLGQNNGAPGSACDGPPGGVNPSTPCEIGVGRSVSVTSSTPITDVLVGSVQSGFEAFQVWTNNGSGWSQVGGDLSLKGDVSGTSACNQVGSASECQIDLTTPVSEIGVVDLAGNAPSDVLVVGVSPVPAPIIGQGLPVALAIGGLLFGARLWERSKQHRSLGTAVPHAMA
jgi:hypothetical protein